LQAGNYSFNLLPPAGYAASLRHTIQVQVFPGAAYAASSYLSVAAPPVPVIGSRVNITVNLRDAYANGVADPASDPDSQVWLEVRGELVASVMLQPGHEGCTLLGWALMFGELIPATFCLHAFTFIHNHGQ
jgi:hypothetical protein